MTKQLKRASRMVDFGIEEAEVSFVLGPRPTKKEVKKVLDQLEGLKEEEKKEIKQ